MTKRRDVLKRIAKQAKASGAVWELDREGANHSVYHLDGVVIPVPRHADIDNGMAEAIYRECAEVLGRNWWRR